MEPGSQITPVESSPIRRQNHSCDQCRQSKRRCMSTTDAKLEDTPFTKCCNCQNLRQNCTYQFAKQRNATKKKTRTAIAARVQPVLDRSTSKVQDLNVFLPKEPETSTPSPSESSLFADGSITASSDDCWDKSDSTAFCDFDLFFDGGADVWPPMIHVNMPSHAWGPEPPDPTQDITTSQPQIQSFQVSSSISLTSPILLLSSTFMSEFGTDQLAGIYGSLISGLMTRNVGYNSNFLAGHHAYDLVSENGSRQAATGPPRDIRTSPVLNTNDSTGDATTSGSYGSITKYLHTLVDEYCAQLAETSIYRGLLRTSLKIHSCHAGDQVLLPPSFNLIVELIPNICQYGTANAINLYRKYIKLRQFIRQPDEIPEFGLENSLNNVVDLIDTFETAYSSWTEYCFSNFSELAVKAKLSFIFHVLFWNLGVLSIAEVMKTMATQVSTAHVTTTDCNESKATGYQISAVTACVKVAEFVMRDPREKIRLDGSDVKLPLLAHHANIQLVATALDKAITALIDLKAGICDDIVGRPTVVSFTHPTTDTKSTLSLKPLLWCLTSLQYTNSGSTVTRPIMDNLLSQWGDLLMESWTPEEASR
ncbi:Fc.00g025230.m01.CDS01 [Cosmosporella sp. VM-42]